MVQFTQIAGMELRVSVRGDGLALGSVPWLLDQEVWMPRWTRQPPRSFAPLTGPQAGFSQLHGSCSQMTLGCLGSQWNKSLRLAAKHFTLGFVSVNPRTRCAALKLSGLESLSRWVFFQSHSYLG